MAAVLISSGAMAADHTDGPAASADKTADIADLFTWVSADMSTTYLVMDLGKSVAAGTKFSNAVKYVFHTASMPAYGAVATAVKDLDIICTFDAAATQHASCWIGGNPTKDFVTGDASAVAGVTSDSGKVKLFTGLRDDPFFFNLTGFQNAAALVHGAASTLPHDADGCPTLTGTATGPTLATDLQMSGSPGAPTAAVDAFAAFNTLSIVLAVDTTLLTEGGPVMSVWASTNH